MSVRGFFACPDSVQSILEVDKDNNYPAKTKVACTLGPNSRDVPVLVQLLDEGMSVARIDFSWGSQEYHQETLENLRQAVRQTKKRCGVIMDTLGPEIRVTNRGTDPIQLEEGATVSLTCSQSAQASSKVLPISCPTFDWFDVRPGSPVFIGQYLFTGSETTSAYLTVQKVTKDTLECTCNNAAVLEGLRLIVHFAGAPSKGPILSDSDVEVIKSWGLHSKVDFLSLSFCRGSDDVKTCRELLDSCGLAGTKILAKVETRMGLANLTDILSEADGIMLSRGHLGVEIDAEKMCRIQKVVIQECNQKGKPVIVTRVLDTMTGAPRPTRAEATDVANLVLDGADCILLGAETFRGGYPVETVKTLVAICRQAEKAFDSEAFYQSLVEDTTGQEGEWHGSTLESLASSAVRGAVKLNAALIIAFTITGRTAKTLAKYRPPMPILSVVFPRLHTNALKWTFTGEAEAHQIMISRGVFPMLADPSLGGIEGDAMEGSMLSRAIAHASSMDWIKRGDRIVVIQCPRKNEDYNFRESGVVKFLTATDEVLEAAVSTYDAHNASIEAVRQRLFRLQSKKGPAEIEAVPRSLAVEEHTVTSFPIGGMGGEGSIRASSADEESILSTDIESDDEAVAVRRL
ncbi:unnamed protein product [Ostreobium quekettii]|uniref:Pyruvate kinase n=1 Tax=Ostreobium quekettii TaxID=121088 RepID=A0A8S1JFD3_9CHLO|nr:unnamed protein product [Ostreobium quekettii]|eukprot:evm.model.scf_137.7 EVM.evm.TU.scf_137.7   scf_137:65163-70541(-)